MLNKVVVVFIALLSLSSAIEEDSAKESPCFNISSAVDPEPTWFSSVERWYYPLASRLDFYRSAHDLLETDYKNISEHSLYYDSCLEWGIDSDGYTLNGFDGKRRVLKTTAVAQGTGDFKSEWSEGMVGRAYTTLTDNKTFVFTAACFADNQMSWNVFATTKTLDEPTKQLIFAHAKSLGYKEEYFAEIRYDSCKSKSSPELVAAPDANKESLIDFDERDQTFASSSIKTDVPIFEKSTLSEPDMGVQYFTFCTNCKLTCSKWGYKSFLMTKYLKKLRKFQQKLEKSQKPQKFEKSQKFETSQKSQKFETSQKSQKFNKF